MSEQPSNWQQSITGEWHGCPSVFEPDGTHVGWNKVYRSSTHEGDQTTYRMDTDLDVRGALRARFEAKDFEFGVRDSDGDRIYLGPDFLGAGQPYGRLVDARYYSPAWAADLRTMVHILADGKTQVYSSLLYDGPNLCAVFNGLYRVAHDYPQNPETQQTIDAFVAQEKQQGNRPHVLPFKRAGKWEGTMQVLSAEQEFIGEALVTIDYRPLDLLRAEVVLRATGAITLNARYIRSRNGYHHTYQGPDLYGNGMAYGRALYTTQHLVDSSIRIEGREFLLDDDWTMSQVWRIHHHGRAAHTLFGTFTWVPGDEVLRAQYGHQRDSASSTTPMFSLATGA